MIKIIIAFNSYISIKMLDPLICGNPTGKPVAPFPFFELRSTPFGRILHSFTGKPVVFYPSDTDQQNLGHFDSLDPRISLTIIIFYLFFVLFPNSPKQMDIDKLNNVFFEVSFEF